MDDTFPDLGSLKDVELKDVIRQLTEEETEISYKRRILHGKIDILRAELVNRLRKKHDGGEEHDHRRGRPAADRHPRQPPDRTLRRETAVVMRSPPGRPPAPADRPTGRRWLA